VKLASTITLLMLCAIVGAQTLTGAAFQTEMATGERVAISYRIDSNADTIFLPKPEGFEQLSGPIRSYTPRNRASRLRTSITQFDFEFRAKRQGQFEVPKAYVLHSNGDTIWSNSITLLVRDGNSRLVRMQITNTPNNKQ